MQHVVYTMVFRDGSVYVGSTSNMAVRRHNHRRDMRKGAHSAAVQAAYNLSGFPEFRVVAHAFHREDLHLVEADVINAICPTLNRASPAPLPRTRAGAPTCRQWGPFEDLRTAAEVLGISYTSVKRVSARMTYDQWLISVAERSRRVEQQREERLVAREARKVAAQAYVRSQLVEVDGILAYPVEHRRRLGMSKDRYIRLRRKGVCPFTGAPLAFNQTVGATPCHAPLGA